MHDRKMQKPVPFGPISSTVVPPCKVPELTSICLIPIQKFLLDRKANGLNFKEAKSKESLYHPVRLVSTVDQELLKIFFELRNLDNVSLLEELN